MARVLAIDIGTSSIRATIYGRALQPSRASAPVHYRWRVGRDGSVEAAPAEIERAVAHAIDVALDGVRMRIDAVAMAAFWHSLIGADAHGRALTSVIPWTDTRSAAQVAALRETLDERAIHARTGCRIHSTYWSPRLRWFLEREPRTFRRVRRWVSLPAYLERRWLGRDAESRSQASATGLFLHDGTRWDVDLCRACGVTPEQLSPIVDLDDRGAALSGALAKRWPQLKNARWVPCIGDGAANNLGAGCVIRGRAALMIGTSGALRQMWSTATPPPVPFGLWRYWLDRRRVVVGAALSNGGNFVAWMRQTLGLPTTPKDEARLARLPPDSHGLTVLPFLAGERSPDYPIETAAAIAGLRLATTRDDILRAGLESIGYRFLDVIDDLASVSPVSRLVATGTALTASRVWPQILADVLGRPLALPREGELTSRGAAIVAFEQLGLMPRAPDPRIARVFHTDARSHAIYLAAASRHQEMLRALAPVLT
jgi:gluconokinase